MPGTGTAWCSRCSSARGTCWRRMCARATTPRPTLSSRRSVTWTPTRRTGGGRRSSRSAVWRTRRRTVLRGSPTRCFPVATSRVRRPPRSQLRCSCRAVRACTRISRSPTRRTATPCSCCGTRSSIRACGDRPRAGSATTRRRSTITSRSRMRSCAWRTTRSRASATSRPTAGRRATWSTAARRRRSTRRACGCRSTRRTCCRGRPSRCSLAASPRRPPAATLTGSTTSTLRRCWTRGATPTTSAPM
mmetsp:Transcript_43414/g.130221  ORF Transcript_43414/g.130221 Transcript_43414/m.130221 type:complete len:247 (+) Transcript_43414:334-1074(+)